MSRRLALASALVLAVLAASFAFVGQRAHADGGWASTHTQAISLQNATSLGDLGSAQTLRINVVLGLRNQAALTQYIHDINDPANALYGQELDPATFTATYGPTSDQVSAVT